MVEIMIEAEQETALYFHKLFSRKRNESGEFFSYDQSGNVVENKESCSRGLGYFTENRLVIDFIPLSL